jgi:hypothetical protein
VADTNWADLHKHATTSLEGEFPLVIVEATATKTNDQSKDMIKWKAKIESGPFVDRPVTGNFTISPESPIALRIFFSQMAVLGLDGAFFTANPNAPVELIAQALVGRRAIAVLGTRQWQGREFEDVKEWKPALGGPGGSTLSAGPLGGSGATLAATPLGGSSVTSPTFPVVSPATAAQPSTPAPQVKF